MGNANTLINHKSFICTKITLYFRFLFKETTTLPTTTRREIGEKKVELNPHTYRTSKANQCQISKNVLTNTIHRYISVVRGKCKLHIIHKYHIFQQCLMCRFFENLFSKFSHNSSFRGIFSTSLARELNWILYFTPTHNILYTKPIAKVYSLYLGICFTNEKLFRPIFFLLFFFGLKNKLFQFRIITL